MREVVVSAIQMRMSKSIDENIDKAVEKVIEAAEMGANIVLLPELFEREYFCQERCYEYYEYATTPEKNKAVKELKKIAKEYELVIPVSFYERDRNELYNSLALLDHNGEILGIYRKMHIPDDHFYQEKFYFKPGNKGVGVFNTKYGTIGTGICWDQWFPLLAAQMAKEGAELIFYPTAIGSEPILDVDSSGHWKRVMKGHSAANIVPVIAANRIGREVVEPKEENAFQKSELVFYGNSFMTNEIGEVVEEAERDSEEILIHKYDLDDIMVKRLEWGLFRDRREDFIK